MKIAVSAQGSDPTGPMDPRFGRAAGYLIHDTDTGSYAFIDNSEGMGAAQGAGIGAAKAVADAGATVAITGSFGPKAADALTQAGVRMVTCGGGSVEQVVAEFLAAEGTGKATEAGASATQPQAVPQPGMGRGMGGGRGIGGGGGGCRRQGGSGRGMGMGGGGGRGQGGGGQGRGGGGRQS